ncbi:hypothetical protein B0O99DRAFT_147039 [Bisporella sp. PMI_857]|nr:hypothetical protein B0O99DRAFT_147039 [Bisporella sp. PMI_857]
MSKRSSSSDSTSTSSSSTSSSSTSSYNYNSPRYSMGQAPVVRTLRCSRCAKCVEVVSNGQSSRVSSSELSASGMVSFGTNLYYCDRCAKMVGYR